MEEAHVRIGNGATILHVAGADETTVIQEFEEYKANPLGIFPDFLRKSGYAVSTISVKHLD